LSWVIGVDVGGTFTDFYALDEESGAVKLWKRPSTPENPGAAILAGLREMAAAHGVALEHVVRLCHGTTVATNTLIQRKGRPVALVTTRGFRDLIEIGRQTRPHLYDLQRDHPEPLVPRERRFEVAERIDAAGRIHRPLDRADIDAAIAAIRGLDVEAVCVCFLFAFLNPDHERQVGDALRHALPGMEISLSSAVQPEFREFERFTTTVVNAYLQPVLRDYMATLEAEIGNVLPRATIGINQSSGGLMSIARAKALPVRTALSGPAAGVVGALHVARAVQRPNVITIDVGGTSADVAVIRDLRIDVAYGREVDGFPIRLPMVDISTIGAGGGSIAWFDRDGLLKMGPASAGARPGPACYGLGGEQATLSDANLVLGRLSSELLGGAMRLDPRLAREAVGRIAAPMGKSVEATAFGMIEIAVANMVRAIRTLSVERGHDPRGFALMPFGGAGPLHARDIAAALAMTEIVVPNAPGIICAQGLIVSDLKEDFVVSARTTLASETPPALDAAIAELLARGDTWLASEGIARGEQTLELGCDARHVGQNFELAVPLARGATLDRGSLPPTARLKELFFAAHDAAYGFHDAEAPVEIINLRLTVRARLTRLVPERAPGGGGAATAGARRVHFGADGAIEAAIYRRETLGAGAEIVGPAIIEQLDATTPIHPGDRARVDASGALLIEVRS
jgi:N-methylhydantoinase A